MAAGLVIRDRADADIPEIAGMEKAWAAEDVMPNPYQPTPPDELARYPYLLVACEAGRVIGYIDAEIRESGESVPFPPGSRYIYIEGVYVVPDSRGKGIGGGLLDALVERGRKDGIGRFLLVSVCRDTRLVGRLERRHGFVQRGVPGKWGECEMIRVVRALADRLGNFVDGHGAIVSWPERESDKGLVLGHLASFFEEGRAYSEKEVNAIIAGRHLFNDICLLRRELVDRGLLGRDPAGHEYRRLGKGGERA